MSAQKESFTLPKVSFFSQLIPFFVLGFFCAVSAFVYVYLNNQLVLISSDRLHHEVSTRVNQIQEIVERDIAVIRGVQGLYNASDLVDRTEFSVYLNTLELQKNYPDVYSVVYGEKVTIAEEAQFVSDVRADTSLQKEGYPTVVLYPAVATTSSYVITYIYPETTFVTDVGYRISSDAITAEAIQQAVTTQNLAVSTLTSLPNSDTKVILFILPVASSTKSEGVVILRANITEILRPLHDIPSDQYRFFYHISESNTSSLTIADNVPSSYNHQMGLTHNLSIQLGEAMWDIQTFGPRTYGLSPFERLAPIIIAECIIGIGIFLFLLLYQITHGKERAIRIARSLVKDLEKFQLAVEHASDHIAITDPDGKILYANNAVTLITGFSNSEVMGQKVGAKPLWGGHMEQSVYEKFWKTIKEDKQVFVGEFTNRRKNGEMYIAEVHVAPVLDDDGQVLFFVGIERDVTRAKEVDKMKTEFISLASHQLRTPLSAMKWFIEMLLHGDAGPLTADQKEYIGNIDQSNERMIALVNSLLKISRLESGRIIVDPKPIDVHTIIQGVVKELQMMLDEKKMHLVLDIQEQLPTFVLDKQLMFEVYKNLLSNAIKYTPSGGEITIVVSIKNAMLLSQVSDTGCGIPYTEQDRVFTRFFRGTNISKNETEGTGLGLYLVKAIIDSSGGRIWFKSEQNKGTTFWFSIPMSGMTKKSGDVGLNT